MKMLKTDEMLSRINLVLGIVFSFCLVVYCQDSAKYHINDSKSSNIISDTSRTLVGIIQKTDTLRNTNGIKEEENEKESDSLTINDYLDETFGIGGLVIDHTQSKWGRDFVELFDKSFNPPDKQGDYTIVIEEKPLPQFGTFILIKANGNYIYQRFIQPRYETIKMNAEQGAEIALSYLANYQQIQKDLQGEDLKGTGIY